MKKSTIAVIVIIILVIAGIIYFGHSSGTGSMTPGNNATSTGQTAPVVPTSETTKSGKTSQYTNDELGFSVKYPTAWEKEETDSGVTFILPIDKSQVSTIAKLQVDLSVGGGKCSFPPVTTITDRGTASVAGTDASMISMSNTVQGRAYFDRIYSLQKGSICYYFHFASIALDPASKNLTGSNLTQAQNNNKAIVAGADSSFTDMVKTFSFVQGPAGVDETKASPKK